MRRCADGPLADLWRTLLVKSWSDIPLVAPLPSLPVLRRGGSFCVSRLLAAVLGELFWVRIPTHRNSLVHGSRCSVSMLDGSSRHRGTRATIMLRPRPAEGRAWLWADRTPCLPSIIVGGERPEHGRSHPAIARPRPRRLRASEVHRIKRGSTASTTEFGASAQSGSCR